MSMVKKERGITLIALIITIVVLVILATVTINIAFNNGIIGFGTNGAERYKIAEQQETNMLNDMEKIIIGNRSENLTETQKNEIKDIIKEEVAKIYKTYKSDQYDLYSKVLWKKNIDNGIIGDTSKPFELRDSIYNYSFLLVSIGEGISAQVRVENGMNSIRGGSSYPRLATDYIIDWGFYFNNINAEGKKFDVVRCGAHNEGWTNDWEAKDIKEIIGIY